MPCFLARHGVLLTSEAYQLPKRDTASSPLPGTLADSQTIKPKRVHRCMLCYDVGITGLAFQSCSRQEQDRTVLSVNIINGW